MNTFSMPDPRAFPLYDKSNAATHNPLVDTAIEALATEQSVVQQRLDEALVADMASALRAGNAKIIADALALAPSLEVLRHLSRRVAEAHVAAGRAMGDADLPATVFAIPLIIVAGSSNPTQIPGAVPDVNELIAAMKGNGALRNNQSFALSNSLMSAATLALESLPTTLNWWAGAPGQPIAVPPSRMNVPAAQETAFLRFMIGSALTGPNVNLFTERDTGKWGMPFTQALSKQLTAPNLTVLALPRPPMSPLAALLVGQTAQREVAMQLFVANAIRKFRERVGDPKAVVSAHRTAEGGEVRLSLSNPFDEKGAEGFRATLFANERAQDVAVAMQTLLRECNVEDVTTLGEIYSDKESATGMTLFFKPETIADAPKLMVH
jgi:hypothetical protein